MSWYWIVDALGATMSAYGMSACVAARLVLDWKGDNDAARACKRCAWVLAVCLFASLAAFAVHLGAME